MDPGYHIYTMTGQLLHRLPMPGLKMFGWRPRPPTLLSLEKQKQIRKNLKEYSKEFEESDSKFSSGVAKEASEKRQKQWEQYMSWKQSAHKRWLDTSQDRVKLVGEESKDVEEVDEMHEEVVEEIIIPITDQQDLVPDQDDELVEKMVLDEIEKVEAVVGSVLEHNRHGGKHDNEL
jgi:translation initiation factor 3 subunit B